MTLFGISLRKPTFGEATAAAVLATGLWLTTLGLVRASGVQLSGGEAGALFIASLWACLGARLGLRLDAGRRPAFVNLLVAAVLLLTYQAALAIAA